MDIIVTIDPGRSKDVTMAMFMSVYLKFLTVSHIK